MPVAVDEFLRELGDALRAQGSVDTELAAILETHILCAMPAGTCVNDAKVAIQELAATRVAARTAGQ